MNALVATPLFAARPDPEVGVFSSAVKYGHPLALPDSDNRERHRYAFPLIG